MQCPRCQHENRPTASFCENCANPFSGPDLTTGSHAHLNTEVESLRRSLGEALEQQTATAEILRVISSSPTDVQPIFDAIVRSASRLCGGEWAIVTRYDGELLHLAAQHNPRFGAADAASRFFPQVPRRETSITARALVDGALFHVSDVETEDLDLSAREQYRRIRLRAVLAVPMVHEGRAIGVVAVSRGAPGLFSDRQVDLLRTFADQAVIAIENVPLFKELETRNRDLTEALDRQTATAEVLRVISQPQSDVQPVFDAIVGNAFRLFRAWSASVFRSDGQLIHLIAARGGLPGSEQYMRGESPWPIHGTSFAARCLAAQTVVHIPDIASDLPLDQSMRDLARTRGWRSLLAAPMLRDR